MQFSTASKKTNLESTTGIFVALYLILLAFFIILTKDLSFNEYKQTQAMRSVSETFGRPKIQSIVFGRLNNVKLEDFSVEIESAIKKYGKIATTNNEDKIIVTIPQQALYYADQYNFRDEKLDDMMNLTSIIKRWSDNENLRITINLDETNFEQDKKRLEFFNKRIYGKKPMIGLKLNKGSETKNLIIQIERNI
jgi:hypothetical protein